MVNFDRVAVLGVGLMGASFARALKARELTDHVLGWGRTEASLKAARELGYIDSYSLDPQAACKGADLVVLATPVDTLALLASRISVALKPGAVLIDMGSIKGSLVAEVEALVPKHAHYVGCHPIAGSERSGYKASSETLFDGALCILTPTGATDKEALDRVADLWDALGSMVETLSPEEHDRILGLTSHFPHMAAYAIVNTAQGFGPRVMDFVGPGFKDTTRIARSSPALWRDICMLNRENLIEALGAYQQNIGRMKELLEKGDAEALRQEFERARNTRENIGN